MRLGRPRRSLGSHGAESTKVCAWMCASSITRWLQHG
jgi:hypothetical protein